MRTSIRSFQASGSRSLRTGPDFRLESLSCILPFSPAESAGSPGSTHRLGHAPYLLPPPHLGHLMCSPSMCRSSRGGIL